MKAAIIKEIGDRTTVRDIAVGYPRTIAVFQRYGIDYCRGGMMDVATAAKKGGIAAAELLGALRQEIAQMELEHENAGTALARMRQITSNYSLPADACPTFAALYSGMSEMEADLHRHIHLENNILLPKARELEKA